MFFNALNAFVIHFYVYFNLRCYNDLKATIK
jgi:hypothetical protein